MNFAKIFYSAATVLLLSACHPAKKTTAAAPPATPVTTPAASPSVAAGPAASSKPKNGVFAPGREELLTMQAMYGDVSMETLNKGYTIYTGVCTACHAVKSIYSRPQERWAGIIDDMAPKSKLSSEEKDAVYKYVLSVKATQVN